MQPLLVGLRGTVLALNPATGAEVWRTKLKTLSFVNVLIDGDRVLATARGEIFCLDRKDGRILWHNPLKGLGQGLVTIATDASATQLSVIAQKMKQEAEAAAAGAAAGSAAG
jgi:outer membrane protein assembly factor BamB